MGRAWIAAVIACGLWALCASMVAAQRRYGASPDTVTTLASRPAPWDRPDRWPTLTQAGAIANHVPIGVATGAPQQAPLARVVRNPDDSNGLPPYALTDNVGTIQRYVEPVPDIDLEPYVGAVVRVRHDTGRTLLASQLELPPQPLSPLAPLAEASGSDGVRTSAADESGPIEMTARPAKPVKTVHAADFVDDDDATVQLLADAEETLPDGKGAPPGDAAQMESMDASGCARRSRRGCRWKAAKCTASPSTWAPLRWRWVALWKWGCPAWNTPAEWVNPWKSVRSVVVTMCGRGYGGPGYGGPNGEGWGPACQCHPQMSRFFADVQLNFLRAHVMENLAGKLSEKYEFSPRVIVGFDGTGKSTAGPGIGTTAAIRRSSTEEGPSASTSTWSISRRLARWRCANSDLVLAAGLRTANINLDDDEGDSAGCDLLGMTVAADFHTLLCQAKRGEFVGVCGARLSLLAGDWGQDGNNDFIPSQVQDDNVVVDELYAGVAFETCCRKLDLHAQLGFEMQNWHSDALSQFAGADSIGFIGPGIEIGAEF